MKKFAGKWKEKISSGFDNARTRFQQSCDKFDGKALIGRMQQNLSDTLGKSWEKYDEAIGIVKEKYERIKEQAMFNLALSNACPLEKENLSFEAANSLARSLAEKTEGGDETHRKFVAAVEVISIILGQLRENLSDPDYGNLQSVNDTLEKANLANLEVARRMADKSLYVGLLGEFSCGKSTFINALLEEKFLHEDIIQGTTCAKTVVTYSPHENIRVIFDNDTCIDLPAEKDEVLIDPEKKRAFIRLMTADESRAASIREVICQMPNSVLINGLAIVDTPGIGSANPRHIEVTRSAMRDCDAVLVLTTLDKPLSAELLEGVKKLVGEDAPNCLFIGTRRDQLQERELPRQARHFQKKLWNVFGRECQFEFVSAYAALEELAGRPAPAAALGDFRAFRDRLKSFLEKNRRVIQARKTQFLIKDIIDNLSRSFEIRKEEFAKNILVYREEVIPRDSGKWAAWQKEMEKMFLAGLEEIKYSAREKAEDLVQRIYRKIQSEIEACDDNSKLKNYLASGINDTLRGYNQQIENSTIKFIHDPMQRNLQTCLREYGEKFKKEYDKIEHIFGMSLHKSSGAIIKKSMKVKTKANVAGYGSLASEMETEENIKMGGGLATGIGVSLLVPGVGWLVGGTLAVLGLALGAGLMKSLKKRKEEALEKVEESMGKFRSQYLSSLESAYNSLVPQFKKTFGEAIKTRKDGYDSVIENHNRFLENLSVKMAKSSEFITEKMAMLSSIGETLVQAAPEQDFIFNGEEHEAGN